MIRKVNKAPGVWLLIVSLVGVSYCGAVKWYNVDQAKQLRRQKYDSAAKVERVIGMSFPEFKIQDYSESYVKDDRMLVYMCKAKAEFNKMPSHGFFQQLDSLCTLPGSHWQKGGRTYVFDSIRTGVGTSVIDLSLFLTEGRPELTLEYDVTVAGDLSSQ